MKTRPAIDANRTTYGWWRLAVVLPEDVRQTISPSVAYGPTRRAALVTLAARLRVALALVERRIARGR